MVLEVVGSSPIIHPILYNRRGIAKSVRHQILILACVGSSPATPATFLFDPLAQLVEHLTFNQGVGRSSRPWVTIFLQITAKRQFFFA